MSLRFSFYNPRQTVYNLDRRVITALYKTYRAYGVIPRLEDNSNNTQHLALLHLSMICEAHYIDVKSLLEVLDSYQKG